VKVGDLIRHKRTGDVGLVIEMPRSLVHCGMVHVWKHPHYYDWAHKGCEVISAG